MSDRVTYLGTGIGDLNAAKRYLRRKFNQGAPQPLVGRPGARFYVTARAGRRTAFLLGPYVSPMTALENVPRGRILAHNRSSREAEFAAFGTASVVGKVATLFGR